MVDDSRRCTAKGEQTGERCKRPAVPGKRVCYTHGARGGATKGNLDTRAVRPAAEATRADVGRLVAACRHALDSAGAGHGAASRRASEPEAERPVSHRARAEVGRLAAATRHAMDGTRAGHGAAT